MATCNVIKIIKKKLNRRRLIKYRTVVNTSTGHLNALKTFADNQIAQFERDIKSIENDIQKNKTMNMNTLKQAARVISMKKSRIKNMQAFSEYIGGFVDKIDELFQFKLLAQGV